MANEQAPIGGDATYEAGADLSGKQYYIVELANTGKVTVCDAASDVGIGVLQNKPKAGEAAQVRLTPGSLSKVVSDGSGTAIAIGDWVGTDGNGKAVKKTADKAWVIGRAESASSANGTIITVRIEPHYLAA